MLSSATGKHARHTCLLEEILHQLICKTIPMIYKVSYIQRVVGFLKKSTGPHITFLQLSDRFKGPSYVASQIELSRSSKRKDFE